jgi:hypothetical protein
MQTGLLIAGQTRMTRVANHALPTQKICRVQIKFVKKAENHEMSAKIKIIVDKQRNIRYHIDMQKLLG